MINVLIADDHAIVRKGLRQILADTIHIQNIGEAASVDDLYAQLQLKNWDVLVMDLSMPGIKGLDLLKSVRQTYPALPVLVLSMHPEEQFGVESLRAGAAGYISKESAAENLVTAVKKIYAGGKYITQRVAERLATEIEDESNRARHEKLSRREREVMCRLAAGMKVKEIAEVLELDVRTISTYRARILDKMGMKSNSEITHYAIVNGLLE